MHAALVIDWGCFPLAVDFSRYVIGWQVSTGLRTDLALDALDMAIWNRRRTGADLAGLTHDSDRGAQYQASRYSQRLADEEAVAPVGSKGDPYDNAMAEAFNSLLKAELIRHHGPLRGINDGEIATAEHIEWFNHRRQHGEIGLIPPVELETAHAAERQPASKPTTATAPAATSRLSRYQTRCSTLPRR